MHGAKISMGILSITEAVDPENQPWNLNAELEHEETLVVLQNNIQRGSFD